MGYGQDKRRCKLLCLIAHIVIYYYLQMSCSITSEIWMQ